MQASIICARSGCPVAVLKQWLRDGLIVPVSGPTGTGNHANYDDANLIALTLALEMRAIGFVPSRLREHFLAIQARLRETSQIEWRNIRFRLTKDRLEMLEIGDGNHSAPVAIMIELASLQQSLLPTDGDRQRTLNFGYQTIGGNR